MPRASWGISAADMDDFDRSTVFTPFTGPTPPVGVVYQWRLKLLKFFGADRERNAQFWVGTELVPRAGRDEKKFAGFYVMTFLTITPRSQMFWTPFTDTLGIRGRDMEDTITDDEGVVKRIGRWRNDGKQLLLGKLDSKDDQEGKERMALTWFGPVSPDDTDDDDPYIDEFDDEEEEDEEPAPKRSTVRKAGARSATSTRRTASVKRRRRVVEEDDDDAF